MSDQPTATNGTVPADPDPDMEEVESFRARARSWLAENMPRLPEGMNNQLLSRQDDSGERARRLQGLLFDGGFAGLCFPAPMEARD